MEPEKIAPRGDFLFTVVYIVKQHIRIDNLLSNYRVYQKYKLRGRPLYKVFSS